MQSSDDNHGSSIQQNGLYSLETQQTQIYHIEGGIELTESCTDGEAIVAAETDEFYVRKVRGDR